MLVLELLRVETLGVPLREEALVALARPFAESVLQGSRKLPALADRSGALWPQRWPAAAARCPGGVAAARPRVALGRLLHCTSKAALGDVASPRGWADWPVGVLGVPFGADDNVSVRSDCSQCKPEPFSVGVTVCICAAQLHNHRV